MTDWLRRRYENAKLAYTALMKFYPFTLENLDGEQWADIAGYEGAYQVSTFGRVKSLKKRTPRILIPKINLQGYLHVTLYKNDKAKIFRVARLVATTFIPNPHNKPEVDHRYGMRFDNSADSLRWATSAENKKFALELGLVFERKLTPKDVICIRENTDGLSIKQLADKFGIEQTQISAIQLGKIYRHVGGTTRLSKIQRIPDDVRAQICSDYQKGISGHGVHSLAKKYGASTETIQRILRANNI